MSNNNDLVKTNTEASGRVPTLRGRSSVVERSVHIGKVTGSTPVAPTMVDKIIGAAIYLIVFIGLGLPISALAAATIRFRSLPKAVEYLWGILSGG